MTTCPDSLMRIVVNKTKARDRNESSNRTEYRTFSGFVGSLVKPFARIQVGAENPGSEAKSV